ncbi:imelysin family protein [Christiangramia salexigens]|uniref:Peptidase M75 superfamily protein n=1 Tax=Christiangramia salexigens TaxID=1913577 RepID=A0A1L3J1C2_9FLAO|nr:imelysin family protein [Christiangramia salexigens]APG58919.1 peptidase M75 superfamily protein [Christiangramia salexigens]
MNKISGFLLVIALIFAACSKDDSGTDNPGEQPDNNSFDRGAMLENWADNIIAPAFENFKSSTQELELKTSAFVQDPSEANLVELRAAFQSAYIDFQTVSMFEIGKADQLNYRNYLNTYPANAANIKQKAESGSYNLELPSSFAEQGFPAMDYLINGLGANDTETLGFYTTNTNSTKYSAYLEDVAKRINSLTAEVNASWQGEFRDSFVTNTSSSSTGSVDRFTNDYVMYFEKILRSGKIGYPAGAFTGEPSPENAEAFYSKNFSKTLYLKAVQSVQDFYNGKHFNSAQSGKSYKQYLEYLDSMKNGTDLSVLIDAQFNTIIDQAASLDASLKSQVETNNTKMLEAFDELQKEVVLLKVDMMQALSISVDYVDSDGD